MLRHDSSRPKWLVPVVTICVRKKSEFTIRLRFGLGFFDSSLSFGGGEGGESFVNDFHAAIVGPLAVLLIATSSNFCLAQQLH